MTSRWLPARSSYSPCEFSVISQAKTTRQGFKVRAQIGGPNSPGLLGTREQGWRTSPRKFRRIPKKKQIKKTASNSESQGKKCEKRNRILRTSSNKLRWHPSVEDDAVKHDHLFLIDQNGASNGPRKFDCCKYSPNHLFVSDNSHPYLLWRWNWC